jgi:hypothetical protein
MKTTIDLSINKLTEAMKAHAHEDKKIVLAGSISMLIGFGFTRVQAEMLSVAAYNDLKK